MNRKKTTKERFWEKVDKTDSCWLWTGSKRSKGYGAFVYQKDGEVVQGRAHRYSWELHNGPIPDGLCVLHDCPTGDNPACVNPEHLWLGSKADNNRDAIVKGRRKRKPNGLRPRRAKKLGYRRGEEHPNSRLTRADIENMRADRTKGMSFSILGKRYGVSIAHAFRIVHGKVWQHVEKGGT